MADIRLEVPAENSVLEVLYDGTELYQQPPTMSENLTQLARKIDFATDGEEVTTEEKKEEEEEEEKQPFQQPHWPLEEVRNKVRQALTEMSVLHDLLVIVKQKPPQYMVLDPVHAEPPEQKNYIQFLALKKSLQSAATILLNGAERLRTSQAEMGRPNRTVQDFHIELLRLRQNWRLKKVAKTIIGDLSYRSAGSMFRHTGIFEVSKADEGAGPSAVVGTGSASPISPLPSRGLQSSLRVTVPTELMGSAYIFVCIKKDEEDICSAQLNNCDFVAGDTPWQQKLEKAQNVLFCKELFSQLAREAVKLTPSIPHLVVGNQITATIFPGIHLLVGLCHSDGKNNVRGKPTTGQGPPGTCGPTSNMVGSGSGVSTGTVGGGPTPSKYKHEHDLEHSLHQLLHRVYHHSFQHPLPHPVYAPMGMSKRRRAAGPEGMDKNQMISLMKDQTLLEQIIRQVQHNFLRLRTMYVIDQLAAEFKDPLIVSHWNAFNSPTQSCVKINIVTQGYDTVLRTKLVIHIFERTLKCICRDGKIMTMSFEPQELRNLILCQISQHNMAALQVLAKYTGWTLLSSEQNIGTGAIEPLGNASTVMLASPSGNKVIGVHSGPHQRVSVYVSSSPRPDFYPSTVVMEQRWEHLGSNWQEVRLDRMEGRNFLNKMELLMAALTA
ncbi:mediator of RNA polymerase II transcription subunit 17-like isoform X2 [Homarus americanus]|uniref:mediator of RNA polymerase II transcription subunit 17-like isoform X2 n=1 Tax=Homarus americanus TaxID=6706 RepID=UPI001C4494F3|nr:mediator of RNA polymerase II transcription subunit 17-like isoform X2 [Homarus americanus]